MKTSKMAHIKKNLKKKERIGQSLWVNIQKYVKGFGNMISIIRQSRALLISPRGTVFIGIFFMLFILLEICKTGSVSIKFMKAENRM